MTSIDLIRLSGFCVSRDTHEVGWRARWRVRLRAERVEAILFKPEQCLEHPKQGRKLVKKFVKCTSTLLTVLAGDGTRVSCVR